jgi:hypothetical protein
MDPADARVSLAARVKLSDSSGTLDGARPKVETHHIQRPRVDVAQDRLTDDSPRSHHQDD